MFLFSTAESTTKNTAEITKSEHPRRQGQADRAPGRGAGGRGADDAGDNPGRQPLHEQRHGAEHPDAGRKDEQATARGHTGEASLRAPRDQRPEQAARRHLGPGGHHRGGRAALRAL